MKISAFLIVLRENLKIKQIMNARFAFRIAKRALMVLLIIVRNANKIFT
jgi:hypothetical protein